MEITNLRSKIPNSIATFSILVGFYHHFNVILIKSSHLLEIVEIKFSLRLKINIF
jgi:hypothetical protein